MLDLITFIVGAWEFWLPVLTLIFGFGIGASSASADHGEQLQRLVKNIEYPKSWRDSEIKVPLDGQRVDKPGMADAGLLIRTGTGHGSGVCISSLGLVITNSHVVGEATVVEVEDAKSSFLAPVLKRNKDRDVAALFVANTSLKSARIASTPQKVGDEIFISGAPHRVENKNMLTKGVISKIGTFEGSQYIQTDARIAPGNSGGPAFNESGELIGISVAIQMTADKRDFSHIGLIIPVSEILSSLKINHN